MRTEYGIINLPNSLRLLPLSWCYNYKERWIVVQYWNRVHFLYLFSFLVASNFAYKEQKIHWSSPFKIFLNRTFQQIVLNLPNSVKKSSHYFIMRFNVKRHIICTLCCKLSYETRTCIAQKKCTSESIIYYNDLVSLCRWPKNCMSLFWKNIKWISYIRDVSVVYRKIHWLCIFYESTPLFFIQINSTDTMLKNVANFQLTWGQNLQIINYRIMANCSLYWIFIPFHLLNVL